MEIDNYTFATLHMQKTVALGLGKIYSRKVDEHVNVYLSPFVNGHRIAVILKRFADGEHVGIEDVNMILAHYSLMINNDRVVRTDGQAMTNADLKKGAKSAIENISNDRWSELSEEADNLE